MKVGAELIYKYEVPPQLVINGDETAVQLVNRAKITRNVAGAKRVKIFGMGDDKAQETSTVFVSESGDVQPYQMIFRIHLAEGHPPTEFCPTLTMGALKSFFTGFVAQGILALKTPEMKTCKSAGS